MYYANTNKKKTRITVLILDKNDFRTMNIQDKLSHFFKALIH